MVLANTNVHTYEAAPVFTLVERAVIARLAALVGPSWASEHDGLFVPGGSIATLYSAQPCNDFWREEGYQPVRGLILIFFSKTLTTLKTVSVRGGCARQAV